MGQRSVNRHQVVTCVLQHGDPVLLLPRSQKVRTHQGKWAGVSGSISRPLARWTRPYRRYGRRRAWRTDGFRLVHRGRPLDVGETERGVQWLVHPFLFSIKDPSLVRLNWEQTESRWIDPGEMEQFEVVPMLKET